MKGHAFVFFVFFLDHALFFFRLKVTSFLCLFFLFSVFVFRVFLLGRWSSRAPLWRSAKWLACGANAQKEEGLCSLTWTTSSALLRGTALQWQRA